MSIAESSLSAQFQQAMQLQIIIQCHIFIKVAMLCCNTIQRQWNLWHVLHTYSINPIETEIGTLQFCRTFTKGHRNNQKYSITSGHNTQS